MMTLALAISKAGVITADPVRTAANVLAGVGQLVDTGGLENRSTNATASRKSRICGVDDSVQPSRA